MMDHNFSDSLLAQLSECVATQLGLHFPPERWRDLERGIRAAAREFGFPDAAACIQWLMSSPLTRAQTATLASHLTVGETYFFREQKSFAALEEHLLPELIRARRGTGQRLRIWSAGCCTGEEPYSIAILLSTMIPDLQEWKITILATDIHPRFLQQASAGIYSEWSFRNAPWWIKERYFTRTQDGCFAILPHIQKMVTFASLNLAEDVYPSLLNNTNAMDTIFCRNVLMYFTPERTKTVIHNLHRALVDGGWLIVSPSETSHVLFSQFTTVNFPGAILYRKPRMGETKTERGGEGERGRRGEEEISFSGSPLPRFSDSIAPVAVEKVQNEEPALSLYQEAVALYEHGRFAAAAEKVEAWLSQQQADAKALALLARIYANQGKLAEALTWCTKAIAANKLHAGYHYLLATIFQEQGQEEEAVQSLKRALYIDQHFVLAHFALGTLAQRHGRSQEAKKHFENALSLLRTYQQDDTLPESDGLTAGRLREIISFELRV